MVKRLETRVHASAPTTRKDDDIYRAQAESYFSFHGRRVGLRDPTDHEVNNHGNEVPPASDSHEVSSGEHGYTTYLDETQLAWTAIESQPWPGSSPAPVHTFIPPRLRTSQNSQTRSLGRTSQLNPSAVSQHSSGTDRTRSSYLRSPELERSIKRRRIDDGPSSGRYRRQPSSSNPAYAALPENSGLGIAYVGEGAADASHPGDGGLTKTQNGEQASEETASEMPTSYSLSDVTSPDSRTRASKSQSNSNQTNSNPTKQPQTLPQSNEHITQQTPVQPPAPLQPLAVPRTTSDTSIRDFATEVLSSQHLLEISTLPLQLRPRSPSPSCRTSPGSYVTPALQKLADHAINSRYQPESQTRELDPTERGAWVVDTNTWSLERQILFWKTLTGLVSNGSLGWGIWCSREAGVAGDLGVVRIFCWGEVARHVYLVLYAASESKVRKMGVRWVDADGQEVIIMPSA